MILLVDDTGIHPLILISIIFLIALISVVGLIASIKFFIKLRGGGYEEKVNTVKVNPNDK